MIYYVTLVYHSEVWQLYICREIKSVIKIHIYIYIWKIGPTRCLVSRVVCYHHTVLITWMVLGVRIGPLRFSPRWERDQSVQKLKNPFATLFDSSVPLISILFFGVDLGVRLPIPAPICLGLHRPWQGTGQDHPSPSSSFHYNPNISLFFSLVNFS